MRRDDGAGPAAAVHMGMSGSGGLRSQWGLCREPIEDDMGTSESDLSWMVGDSILCCSGLWGSRMWGFRAPPNPPLSPRGPTFPCSVCSSFHAKWKWGLFFLFFPPFAPACGQWSVSSPRFITARTAQTPLPALPCARNANEPTLPLQSAFVLNAE